MKRWRTIVALVAAVIGMRVPASAVSTTVAPTPPQSQRVTYTYKTYLEPGRLGTAPLGNLNEAFGTMQLTFTADNIVTGTYRSDYGNFVNVTGGRTGPKTFWLSLGNGNARLNGHFTAQGLVAESQGINAGGRYWRLHGEYQHA